MRRLLALVFWTTGVSGGLAAQSPDASTGAVEARLERLVGQTAQICGVVVEHVCRGVREGSQLDLGTRSTEPGASVHVPAAARILFPLAFERRMLGRNVCATGPVSRVGRRFLVRIDDPASLSAEAADEPKDLPPGLVSSCDHDVAMPKVLTQVKPVYPKGVTGIFGTVYMDAIVGRDGLVSAIRVTRSLDSTHGFDQAAVTALQQWRFEPGTHEGKPAPVHVGVSMSFTRK